MLQTMLLENMVQNAIFMGRILTKASNYKGIKHSDLLKKLIKIKMNKLQKIEKFNKENSKLTSKKIESQLDLVLK